MKKVFSVLAICITAAMAVSLCGCGNNTSEVSATTSKVEATTKAAATTVPAATTKAAAQSATGSSESSESATAGFNEQDATKQAVQKAAELYGDGDWRLASSEKTTDPNGQSCYRIGLINYSNSQSPTYYFYSGESFCYLDESDNSESSGGQQSESGQDYAVQKALALASQMYGEGDWRVESAIEAMTPSGQPCWYVGAVNYSNSQSPTYYFYSSDSFTYADEEVNGYRY